MVSEEWDPQSMTGLAYRDMVGRIYGTTIHYYKLDIYKV